MKTLMRLCVLALLVGGAAAGGEGAFVKRADQEIILGNGFLELHFRIAEKRCCATKLVNKLARRSIPIQGDTFSLGIPDTRPVPPGVPLARPLIQLASFFDLKEAKEEGIAWGRRLTFACEHHEHDKGMALGLNVVYELGDADFFIRRRLEVSVPKPTPIADATVWDVKMEGGQASHQGFGQPVLLEDTFWGLEFPGGHNTFANGLVRLKQYPGRTITDRFVSKTAVLGVAEPGRVAQRFQDYIASIQATPKEQRLFVNYNTWWTLMPPTEKNCVELIQLFREKLFDPHGESFDTFTIDDGWDKKETLWELVPERFPNGFGPLVEPLKAMKANLGLWLSPSSGYSHAPHLAKLGYEHNSNPWYCCQSGPKYRRDIAARVTALAKQYDLAFYKFDGFCPSCEAKDHGHLPGPYAQEANIDAYIELMKAAKQAKPGIFLDPTCGMWLSPWWLPYCDSIWGNVSGDYPDAIVPAPIIRDSATTTRDAVFRQRVREHPGYPPSAIEHLGIIVITPEKWEDNAIAVVGRGCRLLTLYINPKFFLKGERDWAFLASVLKWTRHNAETLSHTTLIGGDPLKREWYGYAHFNGSRGIVCLRNPFIEPQSAKVRLDESVGLGRGSESGQLVARIVYPRQQGIAPSEAGERKAGAKQRDTHPELVPGPPELRYGDSLEVRLQGYETLLIHVEPIAGRPILCGIRASEVERKPDTLTLKYAVYGRPGQRVKAFLPAWDHNTSSDLDGQPVSSDLGQAGTWEYPDFGGRAEACSAQDARMELKEDGARWRLHGACVASVPERSKATMHILLNPRGGAAAVECAARVNGKDVSVRAIRSGGDQAHSRHPWTWFEFDLPAGKSDVALTINPSKGGALARAEVGWWLWAEHPLQKKTLTQAFGVGAPLAPAKVEPLPIPINMDTEREIITIQPAKVFAAPRVWPKADAPVAWLDELPPDDVTLGWGKLQANQSVWEKPMTIAGKKFARGLGTHADSRIVYDLSGGKFKTFRCLVGRDEHAQDGAIVFQAKLDGKVVFGSGPMTKASAAKAVEVDVSGGTTIELRTLDGGDGIGGDHGDWAEAQLLR